MNTANNERRLEILAAHLALLIGAAMERKRLAEHNHRPPPVRALWGRLGRLLGHPRRVGSYRKRFPKGLTVLEESSH